MTETLGKVGFDAYWDHRNKNGDTGKRAWAYCPKGLQNAWEAAAQAVLSFYTDQLKLREAEWLADYERFHGRTHRRGQEHRPRQGGMVNVHTKPPTHYNAHPSGVECIEVTRHMPFNLGNVVKYLWRAGLKENESEIKDLEKALDYLHDEIAKRKLALEATPEQRVAQAMTQLREGPQRKSIDYRSLVWLTPAELHAAYPHVVQPLPLRTDNCDPNARCKSHPCKGRNLGSNAFVRLPYYHCLACLVHMGELNLDGSHKQASGER